MNDFTFAYPDGTATLVNITFSVKDGECVVILGANGAGKSTLLLSVAAIYRGTGAIRICGELVEKQTISSVRRHMGFIFQNSDDQSFMPTVLDNVAVGMMNRGAKRNEAEERGRHVLELMGLQDYVNRPVSHLSHGQRKKAALAAVLVMQPDILLFDEPTSGLDPRGRRNLIELLGAQRQTLLIATHDLELTAELADRIIVLDGGRIRSTWTKEELRANPMLLDEHDLLPLASYRKLLEKVTDEIGKS